MKKAHIALLIFLFLIPVSALCDREISLEGLTLSELEALRQEADGRIRLLRLPDADGYLDVLDGEEYARDPSAHLYEKVRLDGEILKVTQETEGFAYYVSLNGNPRRVFLVRYAPAEDERLLLAGDLVTAYGSFEGLAPFDGAGLLESGAPIVRASLVMRRLPEKHRLAADPYAATREDPARLGTVATYGGTHWSGYASFELEMVSACRGTAALNRAQGMSAYNITPLRTQEYLLVWVRAKALSAPGGRAEIGPKDFSFVSAGGVEYEPHYLLNSPESLRPLYEGGEQTAIIACIIQRGDRPLIVYQPASAEPLWFDPNRRRVLDLSAKSFPTLQLNDSGASVSRMKTLLAEMGFLTRLDSGEKFTGTLKNALAEYQRALGLKATGIADEATQRLLLSGQYPPGAPR